MNKNRTAASIVVTRQTDNPAIFRLFKLMYQKLRAKSQVFDPLNQFHDEDGEGDAAGDRS